METVTYICTDYGMQQLFGADKAEADALPKRKDGNFDMRFKRAKSMLSRVNDEMMKLYLSEPLDIS